MPHPLTGLETVALPDAPRAARGAGLELSWETAPSPFGTAVLVAAREGLVGLAFAEPGAEDAALSDLLMRWPAASVGRGRGDLADKASRLFTPGQPAPAPRLVLIGTRFETSVWQALLGVPPGATITYGALARQLGLFSSARAVGRAVGRNPISFLVPCHRVVGADGKLTGYHWGLERKRAMLAWEAAQPA